MMNQLQDSLYLTLSSASTFDEQNEKNNDFITQIYKLLHFTKNHYEVGLSQVIYKPQNDIFIPPLNDYFLNIKSEGESGAVFNIRKEHDELYGTISKFNIDNDKDGIPLTIVMTLQPDMGIRFGISSPYKPGRYIRLPYPTQQILGFRENLYQQKENVLIRSEINGDEELYKSLPIGASFPLEFVTNPNINKYIQLNQPFGSSIEDLVTSMNLSLMEKDVSITFVAENNIIKMTNENTKLTVSFSKKLARIMGESESSLFGESEYDFLNVDLYRGNHLFLVETDIIQSQIYGRQCKSILKIFPQARESLDISSYSFFPIQYCSLSMTDIKSVRIRVCNESEEDISFDKEKGFTCVLHIRLKKNV
jgi:hypothetical protein